jgi:nitrous oxidase accessory protein NosD
MNDDARLERLFADGLHELAPRRAPDRLRTKVKAESGEVRPRARWLALIKEPPMRTNSRLAVGSPTGRAAAIMVATLLATLLVISAGIAGAQLLAADGSIVVDQSGGGHYDTITEAVAMAADGDDILVRPGTYVEAVVIDKDLTLRGDGPVEQIIITAPEDGPTSPLWEGLFNADPYVLLVADTEATISGLTFEGLGSEVILDGGSPTLSDSVFNDVGWAFDGSNISPNGSSVVVTNGGSAVVTGNTIRRGGPIAVFGDADAIIEANTLIGGPHIYLNDYGTEVRIRENTIEGTFSWSIGAFDGDLSGHVVIEGNRFENPGQIAINMSEGSADIIDNEIVGASVAGVTMGLQPVSVVGNTFIDNRIAVSAAVGDGAVSDNVVRGGGAGIVVSRDREVSGNDVEGVESRGISVAAGSPVLRANRSCGNGENLWVGPNAEPDIDESNEICEDAPAAA